jgi:hypothetical protein
VRVGGRVPGGRRGRRDRHQQGQRARPAS